MIGGTIVIEDHIVHFQMTEGEITFTACDSLTGKQYGMKCPSAHFHSALTLALAGDPDEFPLEIWTQAELVMPEEKELRWIP